MSRPPGKTRGRPPRPGGRPEDAPRSANLVAPNVALDGDTARGGAAYTISDLPPTIRKRTVVDPVSHCWRAANGFHDEDGYAQYNGRYAHRVVWERLVGPIPPGFVVDHVRDRGCRWRDCIWPVHLEPVTIAVNNLRSNSASALNARKTNCGICGFAFDLLNTRWVGNRRKCINCESSGRRPARTSTRAAHTELGEAWDALLNFGRAA